MCFLGQEKNAYQKFMFIPRFQGIFYLNSYVAHWAGSVGCVSKPESPLKPQSHEEGLTQNGDEVSLWKVKKSEGGNEG